MYPLIYSNMVTTVNKQVILVSPGFLSYLISCVCFLNIKGLQAKDVKPEIILDTTAWKIGFGDIPLFFVF